MKKLSNFIYYLICIYIFLLPIVNESYGLFGKITDIILILILISYLLYIMCSSKNRIKLVDSLKDFLSSFLGISMCILAFIMVVSIFYAIEKPLGIKESFRFITYIAIVFIIKYEFNNDKKTKNIIKTFVFVTALLSIIGTIQYFTGVGLNPKFILKEGNRITATMQNPNGYGAYLVLSFFPVFMLGFSEKKKRIKVLYMILSINIAINIFLTYSRNSIIGFGIGCVILAIVYNYKILYGFLIIGFIMIFDKKLLYRFSNIKVSATSDPRIKLWKTAVKMIKEHPIRGVGNGNYVALYDDYVRRYPECAYENYHRFSSHNSYLKIQSELGIFGIITFICLIIATLKSIVRACKITNDKYYKMFLLGTFSSVIGFLFMNLFDNLFFSPQTTTYFWLFIAISENIIFINKSKSIVNEKR